MGGPRFQGAHHARIVMTTRAACSGIRELPGRTHALARAKAEDSTAVYLPWTLHSRRHEHAPRRRPEHSLPTPTTTYACASAAPPPEPRLVPRMRVLYPACAQINQTSDLHCLSARCSQRVCGAHRSRFGALCWSASTSSAVAPRHHPC